LLELSGFLDASAGAEFGHDFQQANAAENETVADANGLSPAGDGRDHDNLYEWLLSLYTSAVEL
jgi:hypothetical protein